MPLVRRYQRESGKPSVISLANELSLKFSRDSGILAAVMSPKTPADFHIREARADDVTALGRLAAMLARLHHAWDPQRFFALPEPIEAGYGRFLASEIHNPKAVVLVAVQSTSEGTERVLGYVWARLEPRNWNELLDAHGKLHDVAVDPDARQHGVGRALVRTVAQKLVAMGAPRIVLSTAAKNTAAQTLFSSLGFRQTFIEMTLEAEQIETPNS